MSNKEQLKEIHAAKCQIFQERLTDAKQTGTLKTTGKALVSMKEFSSLAKDKSKLFEEELFSKLTPIGCSKNAVTISCSQRDFSRLEECLEKYDFMGKSLIDDMFE